MYITATQIVDLGVNEEIVIQKLASGEWKARIATAEESQTEVLLSSLPQDLQLRWAEQNSPPEYPERIAVLLTDAAKYGINDQETELESLLVPFNEKEKVAWLNESLRMADIIERYLRINPKRQHDANTGELKFVPGVHELCRETACKDLLILSRYPHRSEPLSPYTLDDLSRKYREKRLLTFIPKVNKKPLSQDDKRWASVSKGTAEWLNKHWHTFKGPRHLFNALKKEAKKNNWQIPSESWIYRYWENIPEVVMTYYSEGRAAYVSKHEPYVPRDYTDLQALQVLCGDHSERDVTVSLPDGSIIRPWLTIWYDLRTGLIWGWYLSQTPSSYTAGQAYADGVRNFGAQPLSRPDDNFYSFIYTDRGRDYRSHNWDGKVITVHKEAMRLDGAIEWLRVQRRVGIIDGLRIKHLLSKGRNPKERPVERVHKDISEWEKNTFGEYCGRDAKSRPDRWQELFKRQKRFEKGELTASPFMTFDEYREHLAMFIAEYNSTIHERPTLRSSRLIPLEEFKRLYTTRYEIKHETLALLLMKAEKKTIFKNGVNCFRKHWYYYHESMSLYKGMEVEVRYSDDDYTRVWVVLPNGHICEATLITPTSLLNPNKQTLETVRAARAHERKLQREFAFYTRSHLSGETTEDRVARQLESELMVEVSEEVISEEQSPTSNSVHLLTYLDRPKKSCPLPKEVTQEDVAAAITDISMFDQTGRGYVKEFDSDV
jgi:Mu transposase, C-terminal